jgi:hypothetical protein
VLPVARWIVATALAAAAQHVAAQAGQTSTVNAEGIAGAKKDFEAFKANRDATSQPKGELPRFTTPELTLPTAPSTSGATKAKLPTKEAKSSNWLVDAMEKQSTTRDAKTSDPRLRDRRAKGQGSDEELVFDKQGGAVRDAEAPTTKAREEREEPRTSGSPAVINPLTRYLDDWMTPQDYALLRPNLASPSGNLPNVTSPGMAPGAFDSMSITRAPADLILGPSHAPSLPAAPRENPFLQSLKPDVAPMLPPSVSKSMPPPVVASPSPAPTSGPAPIAPAAQKPDFAKPPADDKYFKQLKRF